MLTVTGNKAYIAKLHLVEGKIKFNFIGTTIESRGEQREVAVEKTSFADGDLIALRDEGHHLLCRYNDKANSLILLGAYDRALAYKKLKEADTAWNNKPDLEEVLNEKENNIPF